MSITKKLNIENPAWKSCQYELRVSLKFSDGVTRQLKPSQITGLYLEKDYDNDHLPVLMLDLALSKKDDNHINADVHTEFRLSIIQYYVETSEEGDGNGEKKNPQTYLSDTFVSLRLKNTPDNSSKMDQLVRDEDEIDDDSVAPADMVSQTTHVLVRKKDLTLSKKMTNEVLSNASMLDTIAILCSKCGCSRNVLLSNLTNNTKHSELLLEPRQFLAQLIFLESEYGWHREGTYLFLDFGLLYIIRKNARCTVWRKNEAKKVCFCISESTSGDNVPKGVIPAGSIVYYNIGTDQYESADASLVGDQIEGNNVLLVNTSTGSASSIESGITSYDGGSYATKSYHGHNPYVKEQFVRKKQEAESQIQLTCINGDLNYLTPNKQYCFLTDVTEMVSQLKGNYRLGCIKTSFVKNGGYFDATSIITVKRVEKTVTY